MPRCPNPRCQADYPSGVTQCTNPFCRCLLPEAVVAGRYRIETLIGMGGMGAVYRASDTFEVSQVAVKILTIPGNSTDAETAVERFRREARYAHQLRHKHIVPVLNFGQDGQLLYIAMPLITGGTLKSLLKSEHPLPTAQAQRFLNELADAIDAIHQHPQQIVHRDIKPSNLLIHQDDGRLMVTDFGIARAMQQEKALTQRGASLGTEHYIAPEQEQGRPEPMSDVYSMGVIAYQLFTGLLPFQAVVRSRSAELPPPSVLNGALPPALDAVILRAMNIDPWQRYPCARAFAEAINQALASEPPRSQPIPSEHLVTTSSTANIIVRAIIPENPCARCGRENRSSSRFCRYCGHSLDDTSPLIVEVCQVGYASDRGKRSKENEDMLLVVQGLCADLDPPPRPFTLLAIADGLRGPQGKSAGGHEASRLAIETISDVVVPLLTLPKNTLFRSDARYSAPSTTAQSAKMAKSEFAPEAAIERWLRDGMQQANRVIYHCNADYDTAMASTLTTAIVYKHHLTVASIGDSRAFLYNPHEGLRRLTYDQLLASEPTDADCALSPPGEKGSLSDGFQRYLGQSYQTPIDVVERNAGVNDLLLLCSNGIWHMVAEHRIAAILAQGDDPQAQVHRLIEEANEAGGRGNMSAIVARIL